MKEKYGFFGGSFNPVTNAHINLANLIAEKYNLDKVIFVPMGDKYKKQNLISEKDRYEMLKLATNNNEKLEVSDIELNLPYALTMLQAFKKIQEKYSDVKPYFIIGADNLNKLISLSDFEILAKNYEYIVIKRNDIQINEKIASNPILRRFKDHFNILEENPYEQISSTKVRKSINNEILTLDDMIPDEVYEYIVNKKIYKTNMKE
ncbi:MAG: nicotinate (nicotinamide) nucleotide adenylyltransferase [Clostridia bacterium]|nr:nicotinate (nicotinamide) nucleotide adenylyltransferase [Clostridia bacterium]